MEKKFGEDDEGVLKIVSDMAIVCQKKKDHGKALELNERALKALEGGEGETTKRALLWNMHYKKELRKKKTER